MDWQIAQDKFFQGPGKRMTHAERVKWDYQGFSCQMSIGGMWSYRGKLWEKYAGSYPSPEDVGLQADHPFFDPDAVCHSRTMNRNGEVLSEEWRHHGRRLMPGDRLYPKGP